MLTEATQPPVRKSLGIDQSAGTSNDKVDDHNNIREHRDVQHRVVLFTAAGITWSIGHAAGIKNATNFGRRSVAA